jgi:tRNA C32,U32 (ribose-2'-O)-methylase TrmJ
MLLDVLRATGYARRFPANADESTVRQLAMQLGVSHREAMTWMGVLKQVLWRTHNERATREDGA